MTHLRGNEATEVRFGNQLSVAIVDKLLVTLCQRVLKIQSARRRVHHRIIVIRNKKTRNAPIIAVTEGITENAAELYDLDSEHSETGGADTNDENKLI